jgi:hypothetical protein
MIELQRRQLTTSLKKITAPAATKIGDACVTVPTTESGIFVKPMIIATRPSISAQYLISRIGEKALRSFSFSPLINAMKAKIIRPPPMRKNMICDGDKKDPEIFTNVSPTAKEAIEINMSKMPLEFFFWLTNI